MTAFWEYKSLDQMTTDEWESLCDGCGRCCLHKLEDIDTGHHFYTDVACRLLDSTHCRCSQYAARKSVVSDCLVLRPNSEKEFAWLPKTCAYRRVFEGKPLDWWHPLVSGNPETVHIAGISVRDNVIHESKVNESDLEDHIIHWIDF
jgi:uncharacterized cysteine cluster protein YcgN (CxxCxxCC family)